MAAAGGAWFFDEHGSWTRFDRAAELAAEAAFGAGHATAQSSFFNPRLKQMIVYDYDLKLHQQVNTATGYIRKIKRDAPGAPGAAALGGAHAAAAGAPGAAKKAKAGKKPKPPETIVYNADVMLGGADSFDNVTKCKVFQVTDLASDDKCSICICEFEDSPGDGSQQCIMLEKCNGHYFHRGCIDRQEMFKQGFVKCPVCKTPYGVELGPQPSGTMIIQCHDPPICCEGYGQDGTFLIDYFFGNGLQTTNMPSPGVPYSGTHRQAFLPNSSEGREVLELFKTAFTRGLVFAVGQSVTTGRQNTTVWNGIHHKTSLNGGSSNFGYPDEGYFGRVKEELSQKGIE